MLIFTLKSAAQIPGCSDPQALNYNPSASKNDGSCVYSPASVTPDISVDLPGTITETSGLTFWMNNLWTHNDNDDINIYSPDTITGIIVQSLPLTGTQNKDWEEISQDNEYIYIGDFGNNSSGNRTDLKILRINKSSTLSGSLKIDTINFSYSDQTDFSPAGSNNTNFDCEAMIVSTDSIYLFTKQWLNQKTSVYSLPKTAGTYQAKKKSTFDVEGLITGSAYLQSKRLIVLCGYTSLLEPFLYLLYDFIGLDFFSGNKRKVTIPLTFHQIEGIATSNGLKYYLTNENLTLQPYLNVQQKLHCLNLNPFLENYLESLSSTVEKSGMNADYIIYPVPSENMITVKSENNLQDKSFRIINYTGQTIMTGKLTGQKDHIDLSSLSSGLYILKIGNNNCKHFKIIRK